MSSLFSLPPSLCAAFPKATQLQTTRIFLCVAFDIQTDRVTAYLQTTEVPISLWIFPVWPHKPTYLQRPSCLALHTAHWLLHGLPQSSARFSSCHVLSTHTNCMDYLLQQQYSKSPFVLQEETPKKQFASSFCPGTPDPLLKSQDKYLFFTRFFYIIKGTVIVCQTQLQAFWTQCFLLLHFCTMPDA